MSETKGKAIEIVKTQECVLLPMQLVKIFDVAKLWKYDARQFMVFIENDNLNPTTTETRCVFILEATRLHSRTKKLSEIYRNTGDPVTKLPYYAITSATSTTGVINSKTAAAQLDMEIDTGRAVLVALNRDGVSQWLRENVVGVSKFVLENRVGKLPTNYLDMSSAEFANWLDAATLKNVSGITAFIPSSLAPSKRTFDVATINTVDGDGAKIYRSKTSEQGDEKSSKRHRIQP